MNKNTVLGAIAGFAVGATAAIMGKITVDKVVKEIKSEMSEQRFTSPEGDNFVTVSYGSSNTANGLTFIRIKAAFEPDNDDEACKLVMFTKKMPVTLEAQWTDNDNFKLLVGSGKRKQCCDISFEEDGISASYYLTKSR